MIDSQEIFTQTAQGSRHMKKKKKTNKQTNKQTKAKTKQNKTRQKTKQNKTNQNKTKNKNNKKNPLNIADTFLDMDADFPVLTGIHRRRFLLT